VSQSDRDRLGIAEVSFPTAGRIAELRDGPHATHLDLDVIEARAGAAFDAPWVARTFEIDCPCPNGSHCGDSHTCEEVESPEMYPASHDEPAADGEGQCVVQIAVPGLESLARRNAEFIAHAREDVPALIAEVRSLRAQLATVTSRAEKAERERDELANVVGAVCVLATERHGETLAVVNHGATMAVRSVLKERNCLHDDLVISERKRDKAERDLAEAVGLLRDTMWTEIGIDSECTSCGATISAGHFETCELRTFLARHGGTP
jgi:hypothetical protein